MTNNKKFWLVLILFFLIPNILVWFLPELENYKKGFYINDYKDFILIITFLTVLSPLYILYVNYKSGYSSKFWYIFMYIILLIDLVYFYIIYSLSNFGF